MGAMSLIGGLLIAYSVPTVVFFMMLVRRAQLVIVMLSAAFFWLGALTVSSLIWSAIPPLRDSSNGWAIVPVGVIVTEAARAIFIRFYFRCERSFSTVSINAIVFPLIDIYSSIAAGVGFGAMHSFMYFATILANSLGDGALFNSHCPQFSTFFSAAWTSFFFNVCHICWMILAFDAWRTMHLFKVSIVVALHASASAFTIVNNVDDGCVIALPLIAAVTLISILYTLLITHRPEYRSSKAKNLHSS